MQPLVKAGAGPTEWKLTVPYNNFITEFAGVCLRGGSYDKNYYDRAIALLKSIPLDPTGRKMLIAAYVQKPEYGLAIAEAKKYVEEMEARKDSAGIAEAYKLEADIEGERKDFETQASILEKVLQRQEAEGIKDASIKVRLAQAYNAQAANKTNKKGKYVDAINVIAPVLEDKDYYPPAVDAFVNAASLVEGIEKNRPGFNEVLYQRVQALTNTLYERAKSGDSSNPIYLSRLAWVLQRLGQTAESSEMVSKALIRLPNDEAGAMRQQLAGVLLQSGKTDSAMIVLGGINSPEARKLQIGIYLENKDFDKALVQAKAMAENDRTMENRKFVADILSWKGDITSLKEAIRIYEQLNRDNPNEDTDARIAEITLWAKEYSDAVAKYQSLLEPAAKFKNNAPKYGDGYINAASSFVSRSELTPAQIRIAEQLAELKLQSGTIDPLIAARLAWVLIKSKDPQMAERVLSKIVIPNDMKPEAKKEISDVLAGAGLFEKALGLLDPPQNARERLDRSKLLAGAKQWPEAIKEVEQVLATAPNDPILKKEARLLQADFYSYKGEHEKAINLFADAQRDYIDDKLIALRIAEVTLWAKQYEKALPLFQALYDDPAQTNNEKVWLGYASAVAALGGSNRLKAIKPEVSPAVVEVCKRIAARVMTTPGPFSVELLSRLALAMYYCGDSTKADQFIRLALEQKSRDPVVLRDLANTLSIMGRHTEAIAQYSSFTPSPEDRLRMIDIATDATSGEKLDFAVSQARALLKLAADNKDNPDSPASRLYKRTLANVLRLRGDFSESIALYEQLLVKEPKDADLLKDIADVWLWMRNYPEALVHYSHLLAAKPEDVYLGFIDAAASSPSRLTPGQIKDVLIIYDKFKDKITDRARMARLAAVLTANGHGEEADYVLNRALKMKDPRVDTRVDIEDRKELASALSARDRIAEAIEVYAGVEPYLDFNDRINYAILLTATDTQKNLTESEVKKNLAEAERQFTKLLNVENKPREEEVRSHFAEMLMWSGKYDPKRFKVALAEFEKLAKEFPSQVRFRVRIAQCLLWSKQYRQALPKFEELLDNNLQGLLDSAVTAEPKRTLEQRKMARDIWMGFADSTAGEIGTILQQAALEDQPPERYINAFFNEKMRASVLLAWPAGYDDVKPKQNEKYAVEVDFYARSLARLGLVLGLMSDSARGREVFGKAIHLSHDDTELWKLYAQALKLTKQYRKAQAVYDALLEGRIPEELP